MTRKIAGKTVLVVGGAGSIGSSFIKAILPFKPKALVVVDINENALDELTRDLRSTKGMYMPKDYLPYPMDFASPVLKKCCVIVEDVMNRCFKLGNIRVGIGEPPLVIPEMGINHNGNLDVAKKIVDSAQRAGAKIIKHQTHIVDDEMCHVARKVIPGNAKVSIYDIMSQCALEEEEEMELKTYVESKGMFFLSTPFSRAAADRLERFGVHAYKIGSGELNNYPLINHIAEFGKPMIVSTGMNDLHNVERTVNILEKHGVNYALMHTTNLYPTKPSLVRLGAMQEMMKYFPGVPIGLSDHTLTNTACIGAIALGASLVEKHYVDNKCRKGPDVICSMDEKELEELLQAAEDISLMLGGHKVATREEKVTINFAFATCVTIRPIKKGERFTKDNLWVKRPGTGGIKAMHFEEILGKRAMRDIGNDEQLKWEMIEK